MNVRLIRRLNAYAAGESPFTLLADGDVGAGGGGASAGGDNSGGTTTTTPAEGGTPPWAERFLSSLDGLNGGLGGRLEELISTVKDSRPGDPEPTPVDLNPMTRDEFAAYIVGTVLKAFESKLDVSLRPIVDHVNTLSSNVSMKTVNEEIGQLKSSKKDFAEWNTQMVDLAKEHPTLTVTDLYHLARTRNPTRAAELDKKFAPPETPRPPAFGGLFGTVASQANNGAQKFATSRESVEAALRETAARHPVLAALVSQSH